MALGGELCFADQALAPVSHTEKGEKFLYEKDANSVFSLFSCSKRKQQDALNVYSLLISTEIPREAVL